MCRKCRTAGRRRVGSTARTSRTPRSAARSSGGPATAPSPWRTTSTWPEMPRPRASANATRLQADALDALYHYFHPVSGGPDRTGWPFGRPVHVGEVYSVLQGLRGTELVEDARLFGADPVTGQRGQAVQRLV